MEWRGLLDCGGLTALSFLRSECVREGGYGARFGGSVVSR
jgi:hypothetical protein